MTTKSDEDEIRTYVGMLMSDHAGERHAAADALPKLLKRLNYNPLDLYIGLKPQKARSKKPSEHEAELREARSRYMKAELDNERLKKEVARLEESVVHHKKLSDLWERLYEQQKESYDKMYKMKMQSVS